MPRAIPEWIGKSDDAAIPARVKIRVLDRQRPASGELPICPLCGTPIRDGDGTDFDHNIPLIDGGAHRESNLSAVHRRCHRLKTAREALTRSQTRKSQRRAYGIKTTRNPLPGSRQSRFKRKIDGTVVDRRTGEPL